jgi:GSH-dependent disulfide-bond oxidoreductase
MIRYYFNLSPNPSKVALFLEETGLPYEPVPVDTRRGQQFAPEFLRLNPNGKVPVIQDGDVTVFDSNAILLYLGEKTGRFMPADNTSATRARLLSWLMFIATGIGPYSGQAVHFRHFAPAGQEYGRSRYQFEAERHFGIVDAELAGRRTLMGETYTILDMALWGWARLLPFVLGGEGAWEKFPNLKRHFDEINARPAAQRALALKERFAFKAEMDEEARRNMFRHLATTPAG